MNETGPYPSPNAEACTPMPRRSVVVMHSEHGPAGLAVSCVLEFPNPRAIKWKGCAVQVKDSAGDWHCFDESVTIELRD